MRLNRHTIDAVAVQLEPSVVEHKVYAPAGVCAQADDGLPETLHVVSENVLLGCSKVGASGGLKRLDLVLRHVNEKRQVRRVAPEAD